MQIIRDSSSRKIVLVLIRYHNICTIIDIVSRGKLIDLLKNENKDNQTDGTERDRIGYSNSWLRNPIREF